MTGGGIQLSHCAHHVFYHRDRCALYSSSEPARKTEIYSVANQRACVTLGSTGRERASRIYTIPAAYKS
jgi:hypothetical protein